MPNELKLLFAEELGIHDINALARTCRKMNEVLARFVYCRAKDLRTKWGRPYFLLAVDDGNLVAVEQFIEVGASVNMMDKVSHLPGTAIHCCAHFGHLEMAKFLIDKGINVLAFDKFGDTALHSVVTGMHPKESMVRLLVEAGADMEATWNSFTALHEAAITGNVRMVRCLLDLGADPNAANDIGWRPWDLAADDDSRATIRWLLEERVDVGIDDRYGQKGRTVSHYPRSWYL